MYYVKKMTLQGGPVIVAGMQASADMTSDLRGIQSALERLEQRGYASPQDLEIMARSGYDGSDRPAGDEVLSAEQKMGLKHRISALDLEDMMKRDGVDPMRSMSPVERILKRKGLRAGTNGKYRMHDVDRILKEEYGGKTETRMMMKTMLDELGMLDEGMDNEDPYDRANRGMEKRRRQVDGMDVMERMNSMIPQGDGDMNPEDMAMLKRLVNSVSPGERKSLVRHLQSMMMDKR